MKIMMGEKYLWQLPRDRDSLVMEVAKNYNLSFPIAQTIVSRGFDSKEKIDAYLFSSFERDVDSASLMKDAEKAVERILQAVKKKEKILIFGDYDVDGITATAMSMLCLLHIDANVNFYLPNRIKDGYGLSTKIVERAALNNYKLIITVDNGIAAFDAAIKAKELGIDLIITDHHKPHDNIPEAYAVVNPNQSACSYPYKDLAGVGIIFKLLSFLYIVLKKQLPSKVYELLLLGTIADVAPLTGENRFWVRYGLNLINKNESISFRTLRRNSKLISPKISSIDIGFSITPQINALGRLKDPRQGVKFLITNKEEEVKHVGNILFELNETRKQIERSIYSEIEFAILEKKIDLDKENIIFASSNKWSPGVIGLVASRLVSAYGKPSFLFQINGHGIAKGSCRSIQGFNIFKALQSLSVLLNSFGGHSMAAGLSLDKKNLPILKEKLEELILKELTEFDLKQKISLEAEVKLTDLSKKFLSDLSLLEPFGCENIQPSFYIKDVCLTQKPSLLKDAHVKCSIFADGIIKPVIFFNRPELMPKLLNQGEKSFDLAAHVSQNFWAGRVNIELTGMDIANLKE